MSPPRTLAKLFAASALFCAFSGAAASTAMAIECYDYEVVVARGTEEHNLGPGSMAFDGASPLGGNDINHAEGVWTRIRKELQLPTDGSTPKTVVRYDLPYPATIDIIPSADTGLVNLVNHLNYINQNCPSQKFILLGYSQGAAVVGNALSAPSKRILRWTRDISYPVYLGAGATQRIISVGLFADPGFRGDEVSIHGGNQVFPAHLNKVVYGGTYSTLDWRNGALFDTNHRMNDGSFQNGSVGSYPRPFGALAEFHKDKVRDYCLFHDPICERQSGGFMEHLAYQGDFVAKRKMAMFQIQKIRNDVDKSIPVTCQILSSNSAVTGTITGVTLRVRGHIPDVVHATDLSPRQIVFSNMTGSLLFPADAAGATKLRTSLSNATSAKGKVTSWNIVSGYASPNSKSVPATGTTESTVAFTAGQPWTFSLPSGARQFPFVGNSNIPVGAAVTLQSHDMFVEFTGNVNAPSGAVAYTRLQCTPTVARYAVLNETVVD